MVARFLNVAFYPLHRLGPAVLTHPAAPVPQLAEGEPGGWERRRIGVIHMPFARGYISSLHEKVH